MRNWKPEKVLKSHVRKAAQIWRKEGGFLNFRNSTKYDVIIDGAPYPPKAISSIAHQLATENILRADEFGGSREGIWHRRLKALGFQIQEKGLDSAFPSEGPSANEVAQAVEGIAREITVITRSRSDTLRRAALEKAKGVCEACGTDYSAILGGLGKRVLQVHHRQQLSLADEPKVNGIEDVAVVCANCHLIIHADMSNAMPVDELKRRLLVGDE